MADNVNQADRGGHPAGHDHGQSSILNDLRAMLSHPPQQAIISASIERSAQSDVLTDLLGLATQQTHGLGASEAIEVAGKKEGQTWAEWILEQRRESGSGGGGSGGGSTPEKSPDGPELPGPELPGRGR